MRLIDADALIERKFVLCNIEDLSHEEFAQLVNTQPTVDAVEVVRCEDCIVHNKCITEDTFKFAGIKNPFCCVGKKVQHE